MVRTHHTFCVQVSDHQHTIWHCAHIYGNSRTGKITLLYKADREKVFNGQEEEPQEEEEEELDESVSRFRRLKDLLFLRMPSFILEITGGPSLSQGCASTCARLNL